MVCAQLRLSLRTTKRAKCEPLPHWQALKDPTMREQFEIEIKYIQWRPFMSSNSKVRNLLSNVCFSRSFTFDIVRNLFFYVRKCFLIKKLYSRLNIRIVSNLFERSNLNTWTTRIVFDCFLSKWVYLTR